MAHCEQQFTLLRLAFMAILTIELASCSSTAPTGPTVPVGTTGTTVVHPQVVCPNYRQVIEAMAYPRQAQFQNLEGDTLVEFTVTASGEIVNPVIRSSTDPIFDGVSIAAVKKLTCRGFGHDVRITAPMKFRLH